MSEPIHGQQPRFAIPELEQSAAQGCSMPNCTHDHSTLFLTQRCHPKAGLEASYTKGSGVVTLRCIHCKLELVDLAVALI